MPQANLWHSNPDAIQTSGSFPIYTTEPMSKYIDVENEETDMFTDMEDTAWQKYFEDCNTLKDNARGDKTVSETMTTTDEIVFHVEGSPEERENLLAFLHRNKDLFAHKVKQEPALVPAFHIKYDKEKFEREKAAKQYCRPLDSAKKQAVEDFVKQALIDRVIEIPHAPAWSQVLLTPKQDGKFRFCLDYRLLNKHSKISGWPLPNIGELLRHIGSQRPKFFATLDLTSGYHQMAVDPGSRDATTFTTHLGNYRWLRVPMGPSGAPSYFQRTMSTIVMKDIIKQIVEIYLDDLISWAQTMEELINNLEKIFANLRKYGLTLNPNKCKFGLSEIAYVGHLINEKGISFSKEQLSKVTIIELPKKMSELKSFLGLASYFRNHIKNFAILSAPLTELTRGYAKSIKSRPIHWTDETKKQFDTLKNAVLECQLLYHRNPDAPIRVYTDASDYGIGCYVCQVVDGKEEPLGFASKTLSKTERRWTTYEKEALAIYYALKKYDYLLKDNHFTLFTDHRNLTFVNNDPSPKVKRWKVLFQDYTFDIAYIRGEDNVVADVFSRACPERLPHEEDEPTSIVTFADTYCLPDSNITEINYLADKEILSYKISNALNPNLCTPVYSLTETYRIPNEKYSVLSKIHNSERGHFGINITLQRAREAIKQLKMKWPETELRKDVTQFIHRCPLCQKMEKIKLPILTHKYVQTSLGIFDSLAVDTIFLSESATNKKYVLVIIDEFSRYIDLYAIADLTAELATKCLIQYMCTYGCPLRITVDNGSQFRGIFEETLDLLRVEQFNIFPYSHEENGKVERANQEVIRHLRMLVNDRRIRDDWEMVLPLVKRIMNSKKHEATGASPASLVFGNGVDLERGNLFPQIDGDAPIRVSDFIAKLIKTQDLLHKWATENQEKTNIKHLKKDNNKQITYFEVDSLVLAQHEVRKTSKLLPTWRGPFRVLSRKIREQGDIYTCQNLITMKVYDFHVTKLKQYIYDELRTNPIDAAAMDKDEFIVEAVLDHKFTHKDKKASDLNLLIKWKGFPNPEWNAYSTSIRKVKVVHDYLILKRLMHLIPLAYRPNKRIRSD
jgi:hypothetical protein